MQTASTPIVRDIVLVGGGHSHAMVIAQFAMQPLAGVRLTLLCTDTHTPYSGMLPGYVAGHYGYDDVHIDLDRLCVMAGVRFYRTEVLGIDRSAKQVLCKGRPPVDYDWLSINIGATPQPASSIPTSVMPVKPVRQFNQRWLALLARAIASTLPVHVAVVGAGAGGVELLLAMQYRFKQVGANVSFSLFTEGERILPTHRPAVQQQFATLLQERGVTIHTRAFVTHVAHQQLWVGEQAFAVDEVIWATQASGAAWLARAGLLLDERGFIKVHETLQTLSDPFIFAAGDCASLVGYDLEKAGVFAVRQGKPLANNLRRSLLGQPLLPYRPQRHWLALISTGEQAAVAARGGLLGGLLALTVNKMGTRALWRWKDRIDTRFMDQFQQPMRQSGAMDVAARPRVIGQSAIQLSPQESLQAIAATAMRCGGCGAKVGASVLSRALQGLVPLEHPDVLVGLQAQGDAAVVRVPPGYAMVHSVDFFRAFMDDPYLLGRIAANHALGDIFAMGAKAQSATAIATMPPGLESKVEACLRDMMIGAIEVLSEAGCALVGGHTGEGAELALGFAVNGLIPITQEGAMPHLMLKSAMQVGDALILTKPMGTGTLFAARALGKARGRWIDGALAVMQQSNQPAVACLMAHAAAACTDLTGFGLLGHLAQMTKASRLGASIRLQALPVLDGAQACLEAGITSSLQSANIRLRYAIRNHNAMAHHPRYPLLFDPQTAGGLLASVPAERAQDCVTQLKLLGYTEAAIIGAVLPMGDVVEAVTLIF